MPAVDCVRSHANSGDIPGIHCGTATDHSGATHPHRIQARRPGRICALEPRRARNRDESHPACGPPNFIHLAAGVFATRRRQLPLNSSATGSDPRPVLTAETAAAQPENSQVHEWIVFTAWEQVQTTSPAAQPTSETTDQSSAPAAARKQDSVHRPAGRSHHRHPPDLQSSSRGLQIRSSRPAAHARRLVRDSTLNINFNPTER